MPVSSNGSELQPVQRVEPAQQLPAASADKEIGALAGQLSVVDRIPVFKQVVLRRPDRALLLLAGNQKERQPLGKAPVLWSAAKARPGGRYAVNEVTQG